MREEHSALVDKWMKLPEEIKKVINALLYWVRWNPRSLSTDKAELKLKAIRTKLTYGQKIPVIKARLLNWMIYSKVHIMVE